LAEETNGAARMFLSTMRNRPAKTPAESPIDWKALGYLISIVSVFFLGAIAWPEPGAPWWHMPGLVAGMALSIVGMGCRYKAHLDEAREIRKAKAEAKRR
jgi:hypothetical protein